MPKDLAAVTFRQQVLLVEDETMARVSLTRILKGRGFEVTSASSGPEAISKARKGSVSVVVMDILLGDGLDGIEAAEEIQALHPLTSFIFVSAWARDPEYREQAKRKRLRIGGWIEKPILAERIRELVAMIEYERHKLEMLASIQTVREHGGDPYEYLDLHKTSLLPRLAEELLTELAEKDQDKGTDDDSALGQENGSNKTE